MYKKLWIITWLSELPDWLVGESGSRTLEEGALGLKLLDREGFGVAKEAAP